MTLFEPHDSPIDHPKRIRCSAEAGAFEASLAFALAGLKGEETPPDYFVRQPSGQNDKTPPKIVVKSANLFGGDLFAMVFSGCVLSLLIF